MRLPQKTVPAIVGSFPDTEFYDDEILVESGDTLVLVTDGLVEIHTLIPVRVESHLQNGGERRMIALGPWRWVMLAYALLV